MPSSNQSTDTKNLWWVVIGGGSIILFVILLWLLYPFALNWLSTKWPDFHLVQTGTTFGTFGDTYGALNTLFSGLAFAILILSLFLQGKELQAQRKELEAQRLEIRESNAIARQQGIITSQQSQLIAQQIKESQIQSFYNLFFIHLEERKQKAQSLRLSATSSIGGHGLIRMFIDKFNDELHINNLYSTKKLDQLKWNEICKIFIDAREIANQKTNKILENSQYFYHLTFILNFIKSNEHIIDKKAVLDIFISYVDHEEILCFLILGSSDIFAKLLIKDYDLLNHIKPIENEYLDKILRIIYPPN